MLYMVTWFPSIYPSHVSIYTSTMDPMGMANPPGELERLRFSFRPAMADPEPR